jgi:hypothetical protein
MPDPRPEPESEFELGWLTSQVPEPNRPGAAPIVPNPAGPDEGYEVGGTEPEANAWADRIPPVAPVVPKEPGARAKSKPKRPSSSGVDPLWSRGAEWGSSLVVVGAAFVGVGILLYSTFSIPGLAVWVFLLLSSLVVLAVLAYPIFITLERPVRITPEQAVQDYFAAFSHRVPHYKRMWLLLSNDGRETMSYQSFDEFKGYWKSRLAAWRVAAGGSSFLNPFDVVVADFKSEKSAGQTEVEAEYTATVVLHSSADRRPIASYGVSLRLVRGADKMWYLDAGTLDGE